MYDDILFTHDDLDGAGCRILYNLGHLDDHEKFNWKVVNCHNNTVDDQVRAAIADGSIGKDTMITFADIVVSRETFEDLMEKTGCTNIWVFDHHRSNLFVETIINRPDRVFIMPDDTGIDMQSGTSIMYRTLAEISYKNNAHNIFTSWEFSEKLGLFVDTVRSYDTYEWKQTGNILAKQLNTLFWLLGMDRFCDLYVQKLSRPPQTVSLPIVERTTGHPARVAEPLIDEYAQMFIDAKMANEQRRIDEFDTSKVIDVSIGDKLIALSVDTVGMNVSELSTQFLAKYPQYAMFVSYNMSDGGQFSFRTVRDDIDLSEYAKLAGGGGHPKASGAALDRGSWDSLISILVNALPDMWKEDGV